MTQADKRAARKTAIVICFIYSGISADALMMPAIATIANAFPELPFSTVLLIATLPSLIAIPMAMISGRITPRFVKYKTMLVISLALYAVAGSAPMIVHSFPAILICRCIFGMAFGCLYPIGNALVLQLFTGDKRAKLLGRGNAFMNLGVVCMQLSAGFLAAIGWNYVFLAHLYAALVLIIVLVFFKEPSSSTAPIEETAAERHLSWRGIPARAWIILCFFALVMVSVATVFYSISSIISTEEMGSPVLAGFASVVSPVSGVVAGFFFLWFTKTFGHHVVSAGMVLATVGMVIIGNAPNFWILCTGAMILGVGFINVVSGVIWELGFVVPPEKSMLVSGAQAAFMQLGNFLCTPFIGVLDSAFAPASPRFYVFAAAILLSAICVLFNAVRPHRENQRK